MAARETDLEAKLTEALKGVQGLTAAYLFGSHAEARAHRESDADVAVLFGPNVYATSKEFFEAGLLISSRLQSALGTTRVDLLVLNDAPPQLARRVVTTGRRLLCTDSEAERAFVRDVQLRAADLEPFLRRARQLKLASLSR